MRRIVLILIVIVSLTTFQLIGQTKVGVRLIETPSAFTAEVCYHIDITAIDHDVALSTQNYRLYYDASGLRFLRQQTKGELDPAKYGSPKIMQAIHDSDGSGFGNLDFGQHLGFINIIINHEEKDQTQLFKKGEWQTTSSLCFAILGENRNIVWARAPLTAGYASAFTSIAAIINDEVVEAEITDYNDISSKLTLDLQKLSQSNMPKHR
jgi:hypothetical protein